MIPIAPPPLISKGIAVYCPPIGDKSASTIRCEIYYSPNNPRFYWTNCDNTNIRIWDDINPYSDTGTLFLYRSISDLNPGFYTINISIYKNTGSTISGQLLIGITRDKSKLVIGMPFSAYPPITLS